MEFTVVQIVRVIFDWPQIRVPYKTTTVLLFLEVSRQLMIHGKNLQVQELREGLEGL